MFEKVERFRYLYTILLSDWGTWCWYSEGGVNDSAAPKDDPKLGSSSTNLSNRYNIFVILFLSIAQAHMMTQLFLWSWDPTVKATRAASVNASLTPRLRFAEHSAQQQKKTPGVSIQLPHYPNFSPPNTKGFRPHTKIPQCANFLGHLQPLSVADYPRSIKPWRRCRCRCCWIGRCFRTHHGRCFCACIGIILLIDFLAQVAFQCDEHDFCSWAVVGDFGDPFVFDVF